MKSIRSKTQFNPRFVKVQGTYAPHNGLSGRGQSDRGILRFYE